MTWVSIFQNPTTPSPAQGLVAGKERYLLLGWGYEEHKSVPRIVLQASTEPKPSFALGELHREETKPSCLG